MKVSRTRIWLVGSAVCLIGAASVMGEENSNSFSDAIENAKRATVGILRPSEQESIEATQAHFSVRGTGVHIGDGYILTARHAVERMVGGRTVIPKEIQVLTGVLEEFSAGFIGVNAILDIALYRIDREEALSFVGSAPFGANEPIPGDEVFTVGYPLGWGPAIGFGRIGNPKTFLPTAQTRLMQVDLSACSGNSGGGLFNAEGEVVGMIHAIIQTETNQTERRCSRFAFAVPGPLAYRLATALIQGEPFHFPKLGIQMTAVKIGSQWRVAIAKATGPAKKGGLRKGDVILSIDDTSITSASQLKTYLLEQTKPGQQIAVRVLRGSKERDLVVTLGKAS